MDAAVVSPADAQPVLEDHPGAQEANAGHDTLDDARGVDRHLACQTAIP